MQNSAFPEDTQPRLRHDRNKVTLNWTQINAIINGVSAIDQQGLAIRNLEEAERFTREYGFDPHEPDSIRHFKEVHAEAIEFIDEFFLESHQSDLIPQEVRKPENILDLLVYASKDLSNKSARQMWSCAVLKVMHGIFHIDHDFKLKYFDQIRDQIFDGLDKLIYSRGSHHLLVGPNKVRLPIYFYEKKRNKGRKSVLLKLLQKPNYVAADIYDHLGLRLVFETKAECLFALQLMRKSHLVTVTNIKPFRSRNSLVELTHAKNIFKKYRPLLEARNDYPREVLARMDQELEAQFAKAHTDENPHSSSDYQAIQVTARKMIHLPNQAYDTYNAMLNKLKKHTDIPAEYLENPIEKEMTIYFDYEIQLLDKKSWIKTLHGPSSHKAYKARQQTTARKRVLGPHLIRYIESHTPELSHEL